MSLCYGIIKEPGGTITPRRQPGEGATFLLKLPILHMVRDILICRSYQVDLVSDGETGLHRLNQTRYDVMLCDWKMPGPSGQEVYERIRLKDRALSERMICITGDVVNEKTRRFLEEKKRVCLPNPFTLAEFREAIVKMLAAPKPSLPPFKFRDERLERPVHSPLGWTNDGESQSYRPCVF